MIRQLNAIMRKTLKSVSTVGLGLLAAICFATGTTAEEWSGEIGLESRVYQHSGPQGQSKLHPSVRVEAEYYNDWNDGRDSFTFSPMAVFDVQDGDRTHWTIGELAWIHVDDNWELRTGIRTVFWGVTETRHLVDIINQTDLVMDVDGEDKIGQPMINLSFERSWGTLDLFLMSIFEERTFPGADGRLRGPLVVDTDNALFESSNKKHRLEGAVRWHQYYGDFDIAVSHFSGNGREPVYLLNGTVLTPVYPVIDQTGLELQYIYEGWALKLEAISHYGSAGRYGATVFGFEHTLTGIYDSRVDLGWVVEYSYDGRGDATPPGVLEHDLTIATRWMLNDVDASELLTGVVLDERSQEWVFFFEGSRRLGEYWKLVLESQIFMGGDPLPQDLPSVLAQLGSLDPDNKLGYLQNEDFVKIEVIRYF